jgi:hypothetical protein
MGPSGNYSGSIECPQCNNVNIVHKVHLQTTELVRFADGIYTRMESDLDIVCLFFGTTSKMCVYLDPQGKVVEFK